MRKSFRFAHRRTLPAGLRSTQAVVRIGLRLLVIVAFASFSSIGFGKSLAALSWMSVILSTVAGLLKRERPFGDTFNHWDETAVYAALFCLAHGLNHTVPA
jgi:hypothetical protein